MAMTRLSLALAPGGALATAGRTAPHAAAVSPGGNQARQ